MLYIIGLIALAFGICFLAATMRRIISNGLLTIGIAFELIAAFIIKHKKTVKTSKKE
jgi:hypothetical protein